MGSLILCTIAACFSAFSNWIFRKNSLSLTTSSISGYLLLFYFFSFILSLTISPSIWHVSFKYTMVVLGGIVGILNVGLMTFTSKALTKGPAGLTFAFQNASTVLPGLLLFFLFGFELGFAYSYIQLFGMMLVLIGLFFGTRGRKNDQVPISTRWLKYALALVLIQGVALTVIQGRFVFFEYFNFSDAMPVEFEKADDVWFMPSQFGVAFILQSFIFCYEKRKLKKSEILFGTFSGLANCVSTCLLLLATKWATPIEQSVLFPLFAVTTIILCNLWASRLYKEKFNVVSNLICALGVFVSTIQ